MGEGGSAPHRSLVIERRWKKWVYFYIPLDVFIIGTLFPFYWMLITSIRPDAELYRSWRAVNNTPFWTLAPTLEHFRDLMAKTTFPRWLWNTFFIACVSTLISLFCGLLAGYALGRLKFPMAGTLGTSIFVTYLVPPTLLFIPLANIIRTFQLGDTPWALILTYPTFLIPFCTWLLMGYFKTDPEGARGVRAHRRRHAVRRHGADHLPHRGARHPLRGHLRLHAVVERVHLRADLPLVPGEEDRAGGRRVAS